MMKMKSDKEYSELMYGYLVKQNDELKLLLECMVDINKRYEDFLRKIHANIQKTVSKQVNPSTLRNEFFTSIRVALPLELHLACKTDGEDLLTTLDKLLP